MRTGQLARRPGRVDARDRENWRRIVGDFFSRYDLLVTPALATLPIVVLTSEDGPGVERRVLELGADDYIVKPFDPDILLSRVNAVFRRLKVMAA